MRTMIWLLTTFVWALWFGGMIMLFVFVIHLFKADRTVATEAAPVLFATFDRVQLVLGAIGLAGAVVLGFVSRSKAPYVVSFTFVLAAIGALVLHSHHIPRMEAMRLSGHSDSTEFKQLHGQSSAIFTGEAGVLLVGGAALLLSREKR